MPDELTPVTNIEKFLAKTAGEAVDLPEPVTRIEKYLNKISSEQSIINATENWLDEHIDPDTGYALDTTLTLTNAAAPAKTVGDALASQSEKINDLKNEINESYPTSIASGNYAHFADGANALVKKWIVNIPYTAGGVSGLTIYKNNKNFAKSIQNKSIYGITFSTDENGVLTVSGTNNGAANSQSISDRFKLPLGTYILSGCPNGGSSSKYSLLVVGYNSGGSIILNQRETGSGLTFTVPDTSYEYLIYVDIAKNNTPPNEPWYPMIRTYSDDVSFAKKEQDSISVTFGQTIYGGSYDAISGKLVSSYASDGTTLNPEVTYQEDANAVSSYLGINSFWSSIGSSIVEYPATIGGIENTIATDSAFATPIPANSNFNNYTEIGNYRSLSASDMATMTNRPPTTKPGRLFVFTSFNSTAVLQFYVGSDGIIYSRNKETATSSWTEWSLISQNAIETGYSNVKAISANSDVNEYNVSGNYLVASTTVASDVLNLPESTGGRLTVLQLVNTNTVFQIYITTDGVIYVREKISSTWQNWNKIVYVTNDYKDLLNGRYVKMGKGLNNIVKILAEQGTYNIGFANSPSPMPLYNYVGNSENVHPKVLYFSSGFGGHKYWMAYTPYPNSLSRYENPCIAYSDDGIVWTNIGGNPLDNPNGVGYDSDTHLVYRSDTSTLEVWYRYVNTSTPIEAIYRQTSTDGVTWSAKELLYSNETSSNTKLLSPSVIFDGTNYNIWVVDGSTITYYTAPSTDVTDWTKVRTYSLTFTDGGTSLSPWHLDVINDSGTYVMLVMCRNTTDLSGKYTLFITTSSDNTTYITPYIVLAGSNNWDTHIYRASIVKIGNVYRIYYSAVAQIGNVFEWGIGITESNQLMNFIGMIS